MNLQRRSSLSLFTINGVRVRHDHTYKYTNDPVQMNNVEQLRTIITVDAWAFTLIGLSTARIISLVMYTISLGFYWEADPDVLNIFECVILFGTIAYCSMLGFNPNKNYETLREKLPIDLFQWTPLLFGLCSMGIAALRYHQTTRTCPSCPTYVSSGEPDCATNPYAPTSTVDWTDFDTYDADTLLEQTLANNPQTTLGEDPILDVLPQCWYQGCSNCHPRYGWQNWLLIGSVFDFLCTTTFGFAIILIKHVNGY